MIFGFDEHKGKVNVGDMLTQLQTNFQNNVNSLYNAFVSAGTTPTAKTPAALVTAVSTMINTIYNAFVNKGIVPASKTVSALASAVAQTYSLGYSDAQTVTWVDEHAFVLNGTMAGLIAGIVDLSNYPIGTSLQFYTNNTNSQYHVLLGLWSSTNALGASYTTSYNIVSVYKTTELSTILSSQAVKDKINSGYKYLCLGVEWSGATNNMAVIMKVTRQAKKLR